MQTRPTIEPAGPSSPRGRRNPASIAHAKLLSAIRGVKYMADAYPPAWHGAAAVRAGVAAAPYAAALTSQTKER
jgi:hypothetical protein